MQLLFKKDKPPDKSGFQWRKPCRWIRHPTNCVKRSSARCGDFPSKNISDLKTILAEIYESLKSLEPEIEEANKATKAARTKA